MGTFKERIKALIEEEKEKLKDMSTEDVKDRIYLNMIKVQTRDEVEPVEGVAMAINMAALNAVLMEKVESEEN